MLNKHNKRAAAISHSNLTHYSATHKHTLRDQILFIKLSYNTVYRTRNVVEDILKSGSFIETLTLMNGLTLVSLSSLSSV